MGREVAHGVGGLKRQPPRDQLEEQPSERVQVAARLRETAGLLRGHVQGRAHDDALAVTGSSDDDRRAGFAVLDKALSSPDTSPYGEVRG
ncbi:hypothetical protein SMF913_25016 [Streptomyces malaysiensis]|uniref:Uncharacterized protein n=1 Tax=Streptomyces malaysiensis TaxID=92644 RepID=A0A2J7YNF1_STRMQ|nr:hypothetical protein SMF913_25016 [Streptomyces malaysiensis]